MTSLAQQARRAVDGGEKRRRRHGKSSNVTDDTEDSLRKELEHIQHPRGVCTDVQRCCDLVAKLRERGREAVRGEMLEEFSQIGGEMRRGRSTSAQTHQDATGSRPSSKVLIGFRHTPGRADRKAVSPLAVACPWAPVCGL